MARTQALNPERSWSGVGIVLLDDAGMARANGMVFGRMTPTDVISLAYRPMPSVGSGWSGEVLMNVERATREGALRAGGIGREVALYLAHGCQHLSGANDATATERRRMRRRENAWLAEAESRTLWKRLIPRVESESTDGDVTAPSGCGRRARRRR